MESGLGRLIADGARDDEILAATSSYPIPERRWIEATLARLHGPSTAEPARPRRPPGRPPWSTPLYLAQWREAVARGGLRDHAGIEEVAPYFELLDGTIGADPPYLRRLDRRHRRDETPE